MHDWANIALKMLLNWHFLFSLAFGGGEEREGRKANDTPGRGIAPGLTALKLYVVFGLRPLCS